MNVPVFLALQSANQTNAAAAEASRQSWANYDANCALWLQGFNSAGATVEHMRYYAACVERLHPVAAEQAASEMRWLVAGLMLSMLIGAIIGFKKHKEDFGLSLTNIVGVFIGAVFGAFAFMLVLLVFVGAYQGIKLVLFG